jgi:hypothetical protein
MNLFHKVAFTVATLALSALAAVASFAGLGASRPVHRL